jgi:hypothetical protein
VPTCRSDTSHRGIHFPDKTDRGFAEKHFEPAKTSVFSASSLAEEMEGKIKGAPAPAPYVIGSVEEFCMAPNDTCHTTPDISHCSQRETVWHRRFLRFSSGVNDRRSAAQIFDPSS